MIPPTFKIAVLGFRVHSSVIRTPATLSITISLIPQNLTSQPEFLLIF